MKKITRRVAALLCAIVLLITSASALSVEDARELLEDLYVDELPPGAYSAATLEELFTAVGDPYTYYMTAEEFDRFNANVEGETSVTGISWQKDGALLLTCGTSNGGTSRLAFSPETERLTSLDFYGLPLAEDTSK